MEQTSKTNKWNKKYLPITRNRDEKGYILTYTVVLPSGLKLECNTLKEAKVFAVIIE